MTKHDPNRGANVLTVIEDFRAEYGYPPSVREIMPRVGLSSTSAVHHWLGRLERAGLIERDRGLTRGIRVVRPVVASGVCARPGCGKVIGSPRRRSDVRWCSRSCASIAMHVRRWLRDTDSEYLAGQIGLPA